MIKPKWYHLASICFPSKGEILSLRFEEVESKMEQRKVEPSDQMPEYEIRIINADCLLRSNITYKTRRCR